MYRLITIPNPVKLTQLDGTNLSKPGSATPENPTGVPSENPVLRHFHSTVDELTCEPLFAGAKGEEQFFTMPVVGAQIRCSTAARFPPGETMRLSEEDWRRLSRAATESNNHNVLARCIFPHLLAIVEAKVEP